MDDQTRILFLKTNILVGTSMCFRVTGDNLKKNFFSSAILFPRWPPPWVENFDEIALSRPVKEIEAILCFAIFGKNSKWPPFLGRGEFFENCRVHSLDTLWVENFDEIALSRTVKEIEVNLCFAIFGKN